MRMPQIFVLLVTLAVHLKICPFFYLLQNISVILPPALKVHFFCKLLNHHSLLYLLLFVCDIFMLLSDVTQCKLSVYSPCCRSGKTSYFDCSKWIHVIINVHMCTILVLAALTMFPISLSLSFFLCVSLALSLSLSLSVCLSPLSVSSYESVTFTVDWA